MYLEIEILCVKGAECLLAQPVYMEGGFRFRREQRPPSRAGGSSQLGSAALNWGPVFVFGESGQHSVTLGILTLLKRLSRET